MDYDWKVLDDSWGCGHFPIILTHSKEIENHLPRWKLNKANWREFRKKHVIKIFQPKKTPKNLSNISPKL